jgi:molecular chaperone DnaK
LSEEEIQRMVKDAEAHAEEDKKALELVNARNQCDALVHSVKKMLKDHGEQLSADEKSKIEAALKDAEEALKSDDKDNIEAKSQNACEVLAQARRENVRAGAGKQQAAAGRAPRVGGEAKADGAKKDDGNVVDAEYTRLKIRK